MDASQVNYDVPRQVPPQDLPEELRYSSKILQYGDIPQVAHLLGRLAPAFLDSMQPGADPSLQQDLLEHATLHLPKAPFSDWDASHFNPNTKFNRMNYALYPPPSNQPIPFSYPNSVQPQMYNRKFFRKLDTPTLMLAFYHQPNSVFAYHAASVIKGRRYAFNTKHNYWMQRQQTPNTTTDKYEIGRVQYFDPGL